METYTIS